MQLNGISYSKRSEKPHVLSRVGLEAHFLGDGAYMDPYEISAVSIFAAHSNFSPSSVIANDGEIDPTFSGAILMNFANSASLTTDSAFNTSNFGGTTTASGIYKTATGKYIVILNGIVDLSGTLSLFDGSEIANQASSAGDYIDVWTVRLVEGSDLTTFINEFSLKRGVFSVLTEPVRISVRNRLINNKLALGSKRNIKVGTDITFENKNLDESVLNSMKDSLVTSASMLIEKINDDSNLPARVTVSGYSDTSALVEVATDNTLSFLFDTTTLPTHPRMLDGTLGNQRGAYSVKVKYTIFDETVISQSLYLIVE